MTEEMLSKELREARMVMNDAHKLDAEALQTLMRTLAHPLARGLVSTVLSKTVPQIDAATREKDTDAVLAALNLTTFYVTELQKLPKKIFTDPIFR